jgi:hypothetical protein
MSFMSAASSAAAACGISLRRGLGMLLLADNLVVPSGLTLDGPIHEAIHLMPPGTFNASSCAISLAGRETGPDTADVA